MLSRLHGAFIGPGVDFGSISGVLHVLWWSEIQNGPRGTGIPGD